MQRLLLSAGRQCRAQYAPLRLVEFWVSVQRACLWDCSHLLKEEGCAGRSAHAQVFHRVAGRARDRSSGQLAQSNDADSKLFMIV
jgi:hypothetical protein